MKANAKINLCLDITGRKDNGYHLMDMVMQSVSLYDIVEVSTECGHEGIQVDSGKKYLYSDERNTVYKAAARFAEAAGIPADGIRIAVRKTIPTRAGLGGGSADAAAVLAAMNILSGTGMNRQELAAIGEKIGADVPFCVIGGTARVTGIGENVRSIIPMKDCGIVILMPRTGHSTPELFSLVDGAGDTLVHPDSAACERAVVSGETQKVAAALGNIFEPFGNTEETERLKKILLDAGALGACMTGSGAAVFGIFRHHADAETAAGRMRGYTQRAFAVRPQFEGFSIL